MVKVFKELDLAKKKASRRGFLAGVGALAGVGVLAACKSTTVNGVTTVEINVAKINAYGQAGINAVKTIMGFAPIAAAVPPAISTAVNVAEGILSSALSAFDTSSKGLLVVSYNDANWKSRIDSVLADMQTVSDDLRAAVSSVTGKVSSSVLNDAATALNALDTVISFFEAMIGYLGDTKRVPIMTEEQALAILKVPVRK